GLAIRLFASGSSSRTLPNISHVGRAYLRYWLYHYALRLVAPEPHCTASYQRRQHPFPGKEAGPRGFFAVFGTPNRISSRRLTAYEPYDPKQDQSSAAYYAAPQQAASRCLRVPEGGSDGGQPGCACGPHGGGEHQSVSAGPASLHATRTKHRRSTTNWQTS